MSRTDTPTLIQAMRILARDIQSGDGVANAAIAEAADRLEEYAATITHKCGVLCRVMDERDALRQQAADHEARADNAESELAALRAKLPRYANGEAFVPLIQPAWRYDHAAGAPVEATAAYMDGSCSLYPTAAECGEGEGR